MKDNYVRDILKDIVKHTHGLGIFEMAKIIGTTSETTIESVDADKTVILKAKLNNPVPDFIDSTVGLRALNVLDGYLKFPDFNEDSAEVKVISQNRNSIDVPTEVEFKSQDAVAHYRFMLAEVVNQQLKEIKFKGANFDLVINPTSDNLKKLSYFNSIHSQFDSNFIPKTENNELNFYLGSRNGDRTKIKICNVDNNSITSDSAWPTDIVLKILRLSDTANVTVSFNNHGLLQIQVFSGLGEYTYLLPAKG